jgi:biopolymer transport protein TolR
MGMSTSGAGSGGRRRRRKTTYVPMAEINVTPLVDVMLVLLIVFMVAAPLLTVGVPVELPETQATPLQGDKEPLTITVDTKGVVFLQDTEIDVDELVPKLIAISKNGFNERIYVRGDRNANYGAVMRVMGMVSSAGFTRIGLVTDLENEK